jgi:hypothetical protein
MGKREIVKKVSKKFYVERKANGTFKKWTRVGKSLKADRRKIAKKKVKSGYGHLGDRK